MSKFDYYTAPSNEVFNEIKDAAISIWKTYDDTYGYATGKINRIKDIQNIKDNAWFIVQMFDPNNQRKLMESVSPETKLMITEAIHG